MKHLLVIFLIISAIFCTTNATPDSAIKRMVLPTIAIPHANDTLYFYQLEKPHKKSISDILGVIKDILAILGVFAAFFLGYELIVRNLKTETLRRILDFDWENQKKLQAICHTQIDIYTNKLMQPGPISPKDVTDLLTSATELDTIAFSNRVPIANMTFFIKRVILNLVKYYDGTGYLLDTSLYASYIKLIYHLKQYSQKTVVFPSYFQLLFFTKSPRRLTKGIMRYITESTTKYHSFYESGMNLTPVSTETIIAYQEFLATRSPIVTHATFRVINTPEPVARLLYHNKIYLPLALDTNLDDPMAEGGIFKFSLAGFSFWKSMQLDYQNATETVKATYVTTNPIHGIGKGLVKKEIFITNKDNYLGLLKSELVIEDVEQINENVVQITVLHSIAEKLYKLHKKISQIK